MHHTLPKLPYDYTALEPYISRETLEYHHDKHHKAYVDKLNELIAGTEYEDKSLEEIITSAPRGPIFNNAAQIWNHTFYFDWLINPSENIPDNELTKAIETTWESLEAFKEEFSKEAIANFGSGWTWLVKNNNWELEIINTSNAENPLTQKWLTAIITCDIWEHAYYIDCRNARAKYLENFWKVVNWNKANEYFTR